jgi:hypothetical protein
VNKQESLIFGEAAGNGGRTGLLHLRILAQDGLCTSSKDADGMAALPVSERGYLLFPLRSKIDRQTGRVVEDKSRGVFDTTGIKPAKLPCFDMILQWRGQASLKDDLDALMTVFGHLGAIGFRSRRAMGALALDNSVQSLTKALARFQNDAAIDVRQISGTQKSPDDCIKHLASWLRDWRSHGRKIDHARARPPHPPHNSGFTRAENDHDRGYEFLNHRGTADQTTYRPALGLPIVQRFSDGRTAKWEKNSGAAKGRFASPVLLRPHKVSDTDWRSLVIFLDAKKWKAGEEVHLQEGKRTESRQVSLDLYNAMKGDARLKKFP